MLYGLVRPLKRKGSSNRQFTKRIPADVRDRLVGQRLLIPCGEEVKEVLVTPSMQSIRFSLRTSEPGLVKQRQAEGLAYLEQFFEHLRSGGVLRLTHQQAVSLSGFAYRAWSAGPDSRDRSWPSVSTSLVDGEWGQTTIAYDADENETIQAALVQQQDRIKTLDCDEFRPIGEALLSKRGLTLQLFDESSKEMLLRELQKAISLGMETGARRYDGDYRPDENELRFPDWEKVRPQSASSRTSTESPTLTSILEGWWNESQLSLSERTYESYSKAIRSLSEFVGHEKAELVKSEDLVRFKGFLLTGPPENPSGPLSAKTVKDSYLAGLKSVFGWAVSNGVLARNPAKGLTLRVPRKRRVRDTWFTLEEQTKLLSSSTRFEGRRGKPLQAEGLRKWVPWIQAYTGARVGEVIQLRKEDVRQTDGHWIISITPAAGNVKTRERRDVVLHEHLLELGFVDYVEAVREERLFLWRDTENIPSAVKYAAKQLRDFVRKSVSDANVQPNHAWRHTFKTIATEAGIEERIQDAICGHAPRTIGQRYGGVTLQAQANALRLFPRYQIPPQMDSESH